MGEVATSVAKSAGRILGIYPELPPSPGAAALGLPGNRHHREHERAQARMFAAADGFAVLPGGLGTLDEFAEAFTGAQLQLHAKTDRAREHQELLRAAGHADRALRGEWLCKPRVMDLFQLAPNVDEAISIFTAINERNMKIPPSNSLSTRGADAGTRYELAADPIQKSGLSSRGTA
jgi:predicted Rossmann-fold nucleotide-binding protein